MDDGDEPDPTYHPPMALQRMFDLTGRVAVVTGAGQGMGAGIARGLAAHGAFVGVNDLFAERAESVAAAIVADGGQAVAVQGDVRDRASVAAALAATVAAGGGPIDILVHNAGIPADGFPVAKFHEHDESAWNRWMDINFTGLLNVVKEVLEPMIERRHGRIIFISSEAGRQGLSMGVSLYGASKAAGVQMCRHLALENARKGVTVNCLALGRMSAEIITDDKFMMPVGRLGSPADVAAACVYLASDEASFVTGQTLGVNGGAYTS